MDFKKFEKENPKLVKNLREGWIAIVCIGLTYSYLTYFRPCVLF